VNNLLVQDLSDDHFVTAFIGILNPANHEIEYIAGGQGPLILVSPSGVESCRATDLPFAVVPDHDFAGLARFKFTPNATLILLTDGFYETANPSADLFGEERVTAFVQRHASLSLDTLIEQLYEAATQFSAGTPQADDLTAVLIRRKR
jgi:phosphoserine phosphatase